VRAGERRAPGLTRRVGADHGDVDAWRPCPGDRRIARSRPVGGDARRCHPMSVSPGAGTTNSLPLVQPPACPARKKCARQERPSRAWHGAHQATGPIAGHAGPPGEGKSSGAEYVRVFAPPHAANLVRRVADLGRRRLARCRHLLVTQSPGSAVMIPSRRPARASSGSCQRR